MVICLPIWKRMIYWESSNSTLWCSQRPQRKTISRICLASRGHSQSLLNKLLWRSRMSPSSTTASTSWNKERQMNWRRLTTTLRLWSKVQTSCKSLRQLFTFLMWQTSSRRSSLVIRSLSKRSTTICSKSAKWPYLTSSERLFHPSWWC